MWALRVAFVLIALGVPSLSAPLLVRHGTGLPRPVWRFFAFLICLAPALAPLAWIPSQRPAIAMLIAIAGGIVALKAIDWLSDPRCEDQPLRIWLALAIWPALQIEDVGVRIEGGAGRWQVMARRLAWCVAGVAGGLTLTVVGASLGLPERGPWLDSSLKALEIYALAGGGNHLMVAAFALAGYRARDGFRYPVFAHSVLDFWSRYDVVIHRWLKRHIFEPIGRHRRRPALGILAVFAVSGLQHEYLVDVAVPELIGRQFAFFGLHGLGAIGGAWLCRRYRAIVGHRAPRALAIAATVGFVLLTVPVFTRCMDRIVDLHRDVGAWIVDRIGLNQYQSQTPNQRDLTSSHGLPAFGSSRCASRRCCKSSLCACESANPPSAVAMLSQSSWARMIRSAGLSRFRPRASIIVGITRSPELRSDDPRGVGSATLLPSYCKTTRLGRKRFHSPRIPVRRRAGKAPGLRGRAGR
jgi:hypothetical protein